jgi:hypothetical protein
MSNKEFFHFVGGITISNSEINSWCDDVRNHMLDGHGHYNIASGDTEVTARRYESGQIDVCVANSCGHSRVSFYNENELREWVPNYERPAPIQNYRSIFGDEPCHSV